jgi:ATP-dependent Lhr-like helicase
MVTDLLAGATVSPTERAAALAAQLLERHGVLVRGVAGAEELPGGFSGVYPVLKAMEESGRARRGYFVEGLGGAQFALPGALDRLRASREPTEDAQAVVLAATDPANAYGAALPWPAPRGGHAPKRVAGAFVVLVGGAVALYVEKGGRSLVTFTEHDDVLAEAAAALAASGRRLQVQRVDGDDLDGQALVDALRAAGFADHPRGLVLR